MFEDIFVMNYIMNLHYYILFELTLHLKFFLFHLKTHALLLQVQIDDDDDKCLGWDIYFLVPMHHT